MSETLFDKYGGVKTLKPLVREFYERIMTTPNLARYFINTDMEVLIRHQVQFIAVVMGKPAAFYEGIWTWKQRIKPLIYLIVHLRTLLMF